MAPFKLKFRMGSSRSTSQEATAEPDVAQTHQQPLLGNQPSTASTTTIDTDSLGSLSGDSRALLHSSSASGRIGYENPTVQQNFSDTSSVNRNSTVPLSPPPSYEHVLEEISKITTHMEMLQNRLAALDKDNNPTSSPANWTYCSGASTASCTTMNENCTGSAEGCHLGDTEETLDSPIYTCSTMTTPSQENLLTCTGSCDPLYAHSPCPGAQEAGQETQQTECQSEVSEEEDNNSDAEWNSHEHQQQQMRVQLPQQSPEILSNKSSKELYKAVAKQYGITCEMSSSCKCLECACHYFDCEFDENEHQKTDGGLGAGTPMFISEVMHGSACNIL